MIEKYIGLMSGTSLDGMDAVLISLENNKVPKILSHHYTPMPDVLRQQILDLCSSGNNEIERLAMIDLDVARLSAITVNELLKRSGETTNNIKAIGSHGQTIRHKPEMGYTLQIGDPSLIAELTGITVVADFRRRDMAAGGQGAPLVSSFHNAVFFSDSESRVIVNIGGISNISILSVKGRSLTIGFDSGPGNILMDYWCRKHKNTPFDNNGAWAASVEHNQELLDSMMNESFFHRSPPKSTGRELFNPGWLARQLKPFANLTPDTIQATLCNLTAMSIASAIKDHAPDTQAVFVCGGGAKNNELMKIMSLHLDSIRLTSTNALGVDPGLVESSAFAWLARQTLHGEPGNLPEGTGAKGLRILGGIYSK
ncbi:MAG: anhydro-N-acetylmuramic acid kinase [Candidatus Endonucleobacter bathymodioli]|uniref:Anhydro-N-acetylmuramic acid kinase n=1 Tax=Candidatus Endonucleibacter bathymodioli TaxID=539814 RepID=A0AA90ST32_9GAMM|nr:anhydro-N-acetylmuramic acid kinase [Candidatus Endonucleobacter bathymodioli]